MASKTTSFADYTMKTQKFDRKFNAVKSVAGTLHLNVYGALITVPNISFENLSVNLNILPRSSAINSFHSKSKQRTRQSNDTSIVVWNEYFNCRMVWSIRQRTVSYISGQVCGGSAQTIGEFSMDIATFACSCERQICRIPICTIPDEISGVGTVIGSLLLSCEFNTAASHVPRPVTMDTFTTIMRSNLDELQSDTICSFMNEYELRVTVLSVEFVGLPYTKLTENTKYTLHLGYGDANPSTFATIQSNSIFIHDNVCIIRAYECGESSVVLHAFLSSDASTSSCRSTLVYPASALRFSTPKEYLLPMRNEQDHLVAVLSCGCLSKQRHVADTIPPGDRILNVNFIEGNISESEFFMPYFQCFVSGLKPHAIQGSDTTTRVLSTSCFEASADTWNVGCVLSLVSVPSSEEVEKYAIPAWTLQLLCKDASHRENPVVCDAQLTLPWTFLVEGGTIDKWIDLNAPSNATSPNKGRVHVQLNNSTELNTHFPGIGSVLVWLHNIDDALLGGVDMSFDVVSDFQIRNENAMLRSSSTKKLRGNPSHYLATTPAVVCPVAGGHDIISIVVSSAERAEYSASFTTLATIPQSSNNFDVPHLEVMLHASEPQDVSHGLLKLSAIYVPYISISVKLTLSCLAIQENMQHMSKKLVNHNVYFRLCVGGATVALTDVATFQHASSVKGSVELTLNSLELLTVASTRKDDPFECMASLVVESKPGQYTSFAEGLIQLAPLFFCSASRQNMKDSSANITYTVTLFETIDRNPFGSITVTIVTTALSVPASVSRQLENAIAFDASVTPAQHITEYSAKNFFSDLTSENLTILNAFLSSRPENHLNSNIMDIIAAIIPLLNDDDEVYRAGETVQRAITVLDVDNDGSVSWWEWSYFIDAGICALHQSLSSEAINPFDHLVIIAAANARATARTRTKTVKVEEVAPPPLPRPSHTTGLAATDSRALNSRLSQKLEQAISTARGSPFGQKTHGSDFATMRIIDSERVRRIELESEIDRLSVSNMLQYAGRSQKHLSGVYSLEDLNADIERRKAEVVRAFAMRYRLNHAKGVLRRFLCSAYIHMRSKDRLHYPVAVDNKEYQERELVLVQKCIRRWLGQRRVAKIARSVVIIHRAFQKYRYRCRNAVWIIRRRKLACIRERLSATIIQKWFRALRLKRYAHIIVSFFLRIRHDWLKATGAEIIRQQAAIRITRFMRRCHARRQFLTSVVLIQSFFRRARARNIMEAKKVQIDEEAAALLIQKMSRGMMVRRRQPVIFVKKEVDEFVEVYRCEKPLILDAIGYWIRLNGREGQIQDINEARRELSVMFNDDQELCFAVSFDDRNLEWFQESTTSGLYPVLPLQDAQAQRSENSEIEEYDAHGMPHEESTSMILVACERPSSILEAKGKWITATEESGLEEVTQESEGYIESVSVAQNMLHVTFNTSAHSAPMLIPFDTSLHWFEAMKSSEWDREPRAENMEDNTDAFELAEQDAAASKIQQLYRRNRNMNDEQTSLESVEKDAAAAKIQQFFKNSRNLNGDEQDAPGTAAEQDAAAAKIQQFFKNRHNPTDQIPAGLTRCERPPLPNTVGYYIGIMNSDIAVYAKVIEANQKSGMLTIQYVDSFSMKEINLDDEVDTLPYGATMIDWFTYAKEL